MSADARRNVGRVVLIGPTGHGKWHLRNLRRLSRSRGVQLVGVCARRPLEGFDDEVQELAGDVPVSPRLDQLIKETGADVTIVCTPIQTHTDLTLAAVEAGTHVLLEKPPAPTLEEYSRLVAGVAASGRACQVGFQSLGSAAVGHVRTLLESGAIGPVRGIGGACAWLRDASYYGRGAWAGRRVVDGVPVVDGALTNPFAHAVATAVAIAGATGTGAVETIEVELYHANPIEADDTSCLRVRTRTGLEIVIAATLASERPREPRLVVHGERGRITLGYTTDEVRLEADGTDRTTTHARTDLLENLLSHVEDRTTPLLVPLPETHAFMEVVEAVRCAPDPLEIPAEHRREEGTGDSRRRLVPGIDDIVERSADSLRLFSELEVPWASHGTGSRVPADARLASGDDS